MELSKKVADMRREYSLLSLEESDVDPDPIRQFETWFNQAVSADVKDANAMTLATSVDGQPSLRIVLLKGFDAAGFVFYTNYNSRKGNELAVNPKAALNFYWPELERQVRIHGVITKVDPSESDEYFQSRDKGSRVGAWASPQSQVLRNRQELEARVAKYAAQYADTEMVPRPEHWGGYRLRPNHMEFWQGRLSRLHDRVAYNRIPGGTWNIERLAP